MNTKIKLKNVFLFFLISSVSFSCCSEGVPDKFAKLRVETYTTKDSTYSKSIERIRAIGSKSAIDTLTIKYSGFKLPVNYGADSTVYVIERKKIKADTITVFYGRDVRFVDNCNYQVFLRDLGVKPKSTVKDLKTIVNINNPRYRGFLGSPSILIGEAAINIVLSDNK